MLIATLFAAGGLAFELGLFNQPSPRHRLVGLGICGLLVLVALRDAKAGVIVTDDGVEVLTRLRRYRVRWAEIEEFELVRSSGPLIGAIRLRDGETRPIVAIEEGKSGRGGGRELIAELNRELSRHT